MTKVQSKGHVENSYLKLIREYPLSSIRSDTELARAQQVMDRLLALETLDEGSQSYLDALSDLIALYEDSWHPVPPPNDADMLRHLLESRALTQAQLSRQAGIPKSTLSEVLSGKRFLSRTLKMKLVDFFQLDPSILTGGDLRTGRT